MRKFFILLILFVIACPYISNAQDNDECVIIYGLHDSYKPYEWINEDGVPAGMNIDLLKATAQRANCSYVIKTQSWKMMLDDLRDGKITMVASSLTKEREEYLTQLPHSTVLYRYLFNKIDSPYINSLEDLRGKTVLILAGGAGGEYIRQVSKTYDLNIIQYQTHADMIKALSAGEGDAAMSSLIGVMNVLEQTPYPNIRIMGYPFLSSVYGFLLNKKDDELFRKLDTAMTQLKTDGTYFEILKKWSVNPNENNKWYKYAGIVAAVFAVIFLFILFWNKSLQSQVKKKSEKLNEEILFRKSKETELISSNYKFQNLSELFRRILDATPEQIYLINQNGLVSWSNVKNSQQSFNVNIIKKEILNAIATKKPFEISQITDDYKIWKISAAIMEYGEDPILVVASDITENVKLRDDALMVERLSAIGEMAASVAHEINNPTGIIIHNAHFLEELQKETEYFIDDNSFITNNEVFCGFSWEKAKQEAKNSTTMIKESLSRIKSTIGDLKDLGKKRANKYETVDLKDCLDLSVKLMSYFVKKYTNNFSVRISSERFTIFGNKLYIEQVIINIIQNACYALTDKSQSIECSLYPSDDKKYMILAMEDRGRGISSDIINIVCDPFFTTRKQTGGTGLGLAIVSRVMREHKGNVEIKSEEGKGTRVELFFPVEK